MGDDERVKVPNGGWSHQPIAKGKGIHCEVGSGGSQRQTCDLKDMKPIRGCEAGRVGK